MSEETLENVQGLVDLYTAWHAAESGNGCGAKAALWRAMLTKEESNKDKKRSHFESMRDRFGKRASALERCITNWCSYTCVPRHRSSVGRAAVL